MMQKAPNAYTLSSLKKVLEMGVQSSSDGETWHPARPLGMQSLTSRMRLAWEVFTGRADVLRWPDNQ